MIDSSIDRLRSELRGLRKGRGVRSPRIADGIGTDLRVLCGITEADATATVRRKLITQLESLVNGLPPDLGHVARVALALDVDSKANFSERVRQVANDLGQSERTALRRVDEAMALMAEAASSRLSGRSNGRSFGDDWYIEKIRTLLHFKANEVEVFEERTIVATDDSVGRIPVAFSIPGTSSGSRYSPPLGLEILYGGQIHNVEHVSSSHYQFAIELPRTLERNEEHSYGLRYRVSLDARVANHYVVQPFQPCNAVMLTIRFDPNHLPRAVTQVDGVPIRVLDESGPFGETLMPDRLGEVSLSIRHLRPGLAYGVRWSWDDSKSAPGSRGVEGH